jgi:hypothetical protein
MADYTFREKENRPGIVYDETDKQRIFVEDIKKLEACILDLKERVEALEA